MLPLTNRRILVTRSPQQASDLAARLEALGATPILIPTIEIVPPISYAALDEALENLAGFDWLVFTSANAVEACRNRLPVHISHTLPHILTATIGPATARAATAIGLEVAIIPPKAVAESLAAALLPNITAKTRILLVRAAVARDHLPETLRAAGAEVVIAEAYRTRIPEHSQEDLHRLLKEPATCPDAVTFTSSSTVTNLLALLEAANLTLPPTIIRASIGPITTQTLFDHGLPPHLESPSTNVASLAESLACYFAKHCGAGLHAPHRRT